MDGKSWWTREDVDGRGGWRLGSAGCELEGFVFVFVKEDYSIIGR